VTVLAALLTPVADGFTKQIGTLVAGAIFTGAGIIATNVWRIFRTWQASRKQAQQRHPLYQAEKQIKLDIAADRVCQWAGAAHTSIYAFNHDDKPPSLSMVGEAVENNSLARWRAESQGLSTAGFPYLMRDLKAGRKWLYLDECEDYEIEQYMIKRGYKSRLVCLLIGPKDAWLGLLIISWSEGYFTDEHLNLNTLTTHIKACASILSTP
jgi:hypothetical protein